MDKRAIQKAKLGAEGFYAFCQQFGDDEYSKQLLEVLFEELLKIDPKIIHQTGHNNVGESK